MIIQNNPILKVSFDLLNELIASVHAASIQNHN